VFRHVAILRLLATSNWILIGSNAPIDTAAIAAEARKRGTIVEPFVGIALSRLIAGARVLDDDFAPVDQLLLH
jgi:hypothetical protein